MRLDNCKNNDTDISFKNKAGGFFANVLLTALSVWLISLWIRSLEAAYVLAPVVKLSVGSSFAGIGGLGTLFYLWVGWFVAVKANKKAILVISKRKQKILTMACGISLVLGGVVSLFTYVAVNDHLTNNGYPVETKLTNMNIYNTYTRP